MTYISLYPYIWTLEFTIKCIIIVWFSYLFSKFESSMKGLMDGMVCSMSRLKNKEVFQKETKVNLQITKSSTVASYYINWQLAALQWHLQSSFSPNMLSFYVKSISDTYIEVSQLLRLLSFREKVYTTKKNNGQYERFVWLKQKLVFIKKNLEIVKKKRYFG